MDSRSGTPLRLALAGAIAMGCAMGIGRFVYTPILPFMVDALHLSASQAGLIASANFLGYLIGAFVASGPLQGAPRLWLIGALIASAVTTAAVGAFSSVAAISAMRFIGGVASAFSLVFASTQVLYGLARAGRGGLSAVHFGGVGIGIALSALVILLPVGWDRMWFVSGAATLLGAIVVAVLMPSPEDLPQAPAAQAAVQRQGGLARLILAYGLFGFGYVITATFIVAIVRGTPALKAFEPVAWLVVGLAGAPSVWIWVRIAGRTGMMRGYALACFVEAVGVLLSLWTGIAGILLSAILLGGTFMAITALGLEAARRRAGDNPRRVVGLMTVAFSVGQIIGPTVAGYARDVTGSFTAATVAAAVALVIAAALTALPARQGVFDPQRP
ncbi:MAG TPA: YbfB/YjiJ family MFS transporter [Dongiaceae bacterium]|jgi:predicted MFS family arabinose efflux permease|nr:YbfB/YjiJ family MFS transporter [Dongiaceae bacterium]